MSHDLEHLPADVLGLPPLARRVLATRPRPGTTPGMIVPASAADVPPPPDLLDPDERRELSSALERRLTRFEPHVAVLESARALGHPGVFTVVAGQQPSLLGGPLYNVYKAVHAVRLADELSRAWGAPVVPLFWNHADDHDIAEVHHLWVQNQNLDLRKVSLAGVSSSRVPLGRIVLDEETHRLGAIGELLRQTLWDGPEREPALELFLPRSGETFSNAFTRVMLGLFGHMGLVVVEPQWLRHPLSRSLARIVSRDVRGGLARGVAALRAQGTEAAIAAESAALVFRVVDGKRQALRFSADNGYSYDNEPGSRTRAELAAEIVERPDEWSAGGLLRPLVQDLTLPVAAYVGGWGELAYHAELPVLRGELGVPATPFVPRLSATLVNEGERSSLCKLSMSVADALAARGTLDEERHETPAQSDIAARLRGVGQDAARALNALREELAQLDRGLAGQLKRTGEQLQGLTERIAAKAERVHSNSVGRGKRHFRRINNGLYPRELPQERVRGTIEIVARYGTAWIDTLRRETDAFPTEHVVLHLRSPEDGEDCDEG